MHAITEPDVAELAPIRLQERIEALDVIRGFALIGIFLMNVEWFTRPIAELGGGADPSQSGIHYAAGWFVYAFVEGKFWTMFSLLFGMGFAVMLTRAEDAGRPFVAPYLRRILGLFLFGATHFVMVWTGDILHNYAVTALALLLIVTRSWKVVLAILVSSAVAAIVLKADVLFMTTAFAALVGVLMFFLHRGPVARYWKIGVGLYLAPFLFALLWIGANSLAPGLDAAPTPEERVERLAERKAESAGESRVYGSGTYAETVAFRIAKAREELPQMAALSFLALPMFMIGFWFVRSGVVANLRERLPLFRRLLRWTLPVGLGLTLVSVFMHASFPPGSGRQQSVAVARVLFAIGALPLCMAYVSGLVCLLATGWGGRLLSPLRHAGRMALTNYVGASVISVLFFSGYGLGYYGQVPRGWQLLFVLVVIALQLGFSALWLSRFRYGPMEWLWRAMTYWQWPAMRRTPVAGSRGPEPEPSRA